MKTQVSTPIIALVLGSISALGPLAIDMYLPGLPQMVADLGTDEGTIQYSLMVFFAGLTLGQLFYGPLSDRFGRKPLTYFGLGLFTLGSVGSALAGSVESLLAFRALQGLGGSIGMVIAMAVIRDLYTGYAAGRMMALVLMVLGISPVVAPLAGSALLAVAGWRGIFVALAVIGLLFMVFVAVALPETRSPELRAQSRPSQALNAYAGLVSNSKFIPFVLVSAIMQAGFFAYISGSAFVFMSIHGLSPTQYSLLFALNAVGLIIGNQLSSPATKAWGSAAVAKGAVLLGAVSGIALLAMELTGTASLISHSALLFLVVASVGMIMPVMSVRAMAPFGANAGTAAAMMGAIQFVGAALASGIMGSLANGTAVPLVSVIAACAVVATIIAFTAFPREASDQLPSA